MWAWLVGVGDPPDHGGSAHEPGVSVASRMNVPVRGAGTVAELQGGPEPGPPALAS